MNIVMDTFFTIGKGHRVCEDYVASSDWQKAVALSDGCSSSRNTDIGARLVCHSMLQGYGVDWSMNSVANMVSTLGIHASALDCTLLYMVSMNDKIRVQMYGDGNIITVDNDDNLEVINIHFSQEAPYYPIIRKNEYLKQRFVALNQDCNETTETESYVTHRKIDYENIVYYFDKGMYKSIMVTSDGLGSFIRNGIDKVSIMDVARELVKIKIPGGEFIKRRCTTMLRKYAEQGIYPYDDFSVGAFYITK